MRSKQVRLAALVALVVMGLVGCSSDSPKGGEPIHPGDYTGGPGMKMAPGKTAPGAPAAPTSQ